MRRNLHGRRLENMNNKVIYELNTDEFYAYGSANEAWAYLDYEICMSERIDASYLENALSLAYERFPYYNTLLSRDIYSDRFVLVKNDAPVRIFNSENFIPVNISESDFSLVTVSYSKEYLRVRISHILSDGLGANCFTNAMLTFYCDLKYGGKGGDEIRNEISKELIEKEYENPFNYIKFPKHQFNLKSKKSFVFSEKDVDDNHRNRVSLSIDENALLKLAKKQETSVSSVISWIVMQMIAKNNTQDLPISVAVPYDMRKILNFPECKRNCNTTIVLMLKPSFLKKSVEAQLSALRGSMFLQMDECHCMNRMQKSYEHWKKASECKTIEDRIEYYCSGKNLNVIPVVSYIGTFDLGKYEKYYKSLDCIVNVSGVAGILVMVIHNKETFRLNFTTTLTDWNKYQDTLIETLKMLELPFTELRTDYCIE